LHGLQKLTRKSVPQQRNEDLDKIEKEKTEILEKKQIGSTGKTQADTHDIAKVR
jgi:hypothetical protein